MALTVVEQMQLKAWVGFIERALEEQEAYNGLAAIRDAAIMTVIISSDVRKMLDLEPRYGPTLPELQGCFDALYEVDGLGFQP